VVRITEAFVKNSRMTIKPKDNTVVRRVCLEDAVCVSELLAALGYPASVMQAERRIALIMASADAAIFMAESAGMAVGLASFHRIPLFHADGYIGRITSFVVAPSHQKRGVGRLLVTALEDFAWANDCIRVEVTSGDHRPGAHAFYERVGYKLDCRRFIKPRRQLSTQISHPAPTSGRE
jgi:GNAT superfamily N-acetyltransferase